MKHISPAARLLVREQPWKHSWLAHRDWTAYAALNWFQAAQFVFSISYLPPSSQEVAS